jgi:hypothetical protein
MRKKKITHLSGRAFLSEADVRLIRKQVRMNSIAVERYVRTIDLLINREQCPQDASPLVRLRKRLEIAIQENDTFRKVLWRHVQTSMDSEMDAGIDAAWFIVQRIRERKNALMAQAAMK